MKLVIVESPSKAKTIEKYLGQDYIVDASGGHICDLPQKTLGVDVKNNFEPQYVVSSEKEDVVKRLGQKAKKAEKVLLATDPDREGEAISWHLSNLLNLNLEDENRIVFNEISKKAVENALVNPRKVDMNLVDAQQARRVLDRLVGYKLSPFLCRVLASRLSAGRVQSAALRLVVEREQEILKFVPTEYWNIFAFLNSNGISKKDNEIIFKSKLEEYKNKKAKIESKEQADEVLQNIKNAVYKVISVKKSVATSKPQAPFTTSTMQQDASNKLSMPSSMTMMVAQNLYEGVDINGSHTALVTYIRTDSVRISADAQREAKEYIQKNYGADYAPESFNFYKSKKQSQDAHEAIRPITLSITPESVKDVLSKNHYRLYKLIYERFLASQMTDAKFNVVTVDIKANDAMFRASGKTVLFKGYTAVYDTEKEEKDEEESGLLPDLNENDILNLNEIRPEQKFTKPPARYTDATLIKALEEKGIGRPSTYATIISVLLKRTYTVKEGKSIKPTDLAFSVNEILIKSFDRIVDISFTARMEDKLDEIEDGGIDWRSVIADFYPWLEKRLLNAGDSLTEESDKKCEKCGSMMLIKIGRYGKYYACSNYPECSNIISFENETTDEKCDKCGSDMVVKVGRYGKFLACSNYPNCSNIKSFGDETSDVPCEQCGQMMIYKNGKFGRYLHCAACKINKPAAQKVAKCPNCGQDVYKRKSKAGKIYYSCADYKNCKFISWDMPYGKCPKCQSYTVVKFFKDNNLVKCLNKECDYSVPYIANKEDAEN